MLYLCIGIQKNNPNRLDFKKVALYLYQDI